MAGPTPESEIATKRVAILLTGQLRTFWTVVDQIQSCLMHPEEGTEKHMIAVIQDDPEIREERKEVTDRLLRLGCVSIIFFDRDDPCWVVTRERMLSQMTVGWVPTKMLIWEEGVGPQRRLEHRILSVPESMWTKELLTLEDLALVHGCIDAEVASLRSEGLVGSRQQIQYVDAREPLFATTLRRGGSMLEYYQLYLAYIELLKLEKTAIGSPYDLVVRTRPDVVFTRPLPLGKMADATDPRQALKMLNLERGVEERSKGAGAGYILGLRENVVWFGSRDAVSRITQLGVTYGFRFPPATAPDTELMWWWDAESQFRYLCEQEGIAYSTSQTKAETLSLYDYQRSRYYHEDGRLRDRPDVLFFIKRE